MSPVTPVRPVDVCSQSDPELACWLEELIGLEARVHRPPYGTTAAWLDAALASDFWEVAASGRRYDRATFLTLVLECASRPHDERWEPLDVGLRRAGPDTVVMTYSLWQGERLSHRSSWWTRTPTGWQTVYHQGTVVMPQFLDGERPIQTPS